TGEILQLTIGEVDWTLFACPVNVIVAAVFVAAIVASFLLRRRVYLFRWCATTDAAVPAMAWCAVLTLVMGISSWMSMLRWWPLVLCYTFMMYVLGITTISHTFHAIKAHRRERDIPSPAMRGERRGFWRTSFFLFNHLGLFLALLAGTLGNADMQKLRMEVSVGKPEWRAVDEATGIVKEPDVAIELHSFTIDEYPAKLMLVDNATGKTVPAGKPEQLVLEDSITHGTLTDWQITADRYMEMAAQVSTADTVKFVEWKNMGATTAVHVMARNSRNGDVREGWASCGSFMFPYHAMKLSDQYSLVMPDREPRRFASDVTVYTKGGTVRREVIEVNKPMEVDGWKIYQLSYDESMGRWSSTSVFELVRDPWLPLVYTGIILMLIGAVGMFT
ncbi:MAG: cytochrome c biogenesis protein ResB, partial [Bacteroidaceae bacterium]|nr:cytochrome c biogenesis protein ResB [Bacteroidaceae bacterium]